jgi:hypothetical protein
MTAGITATWGGDGQVAAGVLLAGEHDGGLAGRVRAEAAARMAAEATAAGQAGSGRLTVTGRAGLCRRVIREVLDGEAARALAARTPPLAADTEAGWNGRCSTRCAAWAGSSRT